MNNYIRLNLGITKVYLLPCSNGYLLIDTGYETDYKKFRNKLERAGIKIDQIKYLLLTHYHDDHSGFANKLKYEFGIPLIAQKKSVPLLAQGDSGEEKGGQYITRRMRLLFSVFELFHKDFKYPPVLINDKDILVDGDDRNILRALGIHADILFTPGHSADSMSVLCDDGVAIVGDAAMNFLKFTGTHYRPIYYSNLDQTYKSIQKLLSTGAQTILPAHGNPFPAKKLKNMLAHFNIR
jgi:glyoxylase-like metal-dependent hydrolase (beta-lactamase superfamily II)